MGATKEFLNLPYFGLIKKIFLSNFLAPSFPFKITFALTYKCNLRCKYCRIWERPIKDELSLAKIKSILSSADNLKWLHFSGGEIFLREDIEEIMDFAMAKNRKLAILTFPTNGLNTGKITKVAKFLAEKSSGRVKIIVTCSIDGPEDIHDRLRGAEGTYEKCIETFIQLKAIKGIKSYVGVTVSKDNYKDLNRLLAEFAKIPDFVFDDLHFNFLEKSFFYNNLAEGSDEELIDKEVFFTVNSLRKSYRYKGIKGFLEKRYFHLMQAYLKRKKMPIKCNSFRGACFIDPYGDVYPCINYGIKLGNLGAASYNFDEFWRMNIENKNKIRKLIENYKCPSCWTPCEAYPSILSNLLGGNQ